MNHSLNDPSFSPADKYAALLEVNARALRRLPSMKLPMTYEERIAVFSRAVAFAMRGLRMERIYVGTGPTRLGGLLPSKATAPFSDHPVILRSSGRVVAAVIEPYTPLRREERDILDEFCDTNGLSWAVDPHAGTHAPGLATPIILWRSGDPEPFRGAPGLDLDSEVLTRINASVFGSLGVYDDLRQLIRARPSRTDIEVAVLDEFDPGELVDPE